MRALLEALGVLTILVVFWDAFETLILPRRVSRRIRLSRIFFRATWGLWVRASSTFHRTQRREKRSRRLPAHVSDVRDLITVVGNLVDNAIDAASGSVNGWVEVSVHAGEEGTAVRGRDSGPGIDEHVGDLIFREGFTTKNGGAHYGIGLALVRQIAQRRGGWNPGYGRRRPDIFYL